MTNLLLFVGFLVLVIVWSSYKKVLQIPKFYKNAVTSQKLPPSLVFTLLLFVQLFYPLLPFPRAFFVSTIEHMGLIIYFLGLAFAVWGRFTMGTNWGPPQQHDIKTQPVLVTGGAFNFSRNPIYVGLFTMFIGMEIAFFSWLVFLAVPGFFYMKSFILQEEKFMEKHFGKEWSIYKKSVRRFL